MRLDLVSNRVLIFGIDGFTGQHLSSHLEKSGFDIYGTSYSTSGEKLFKVDITYKADIDDVLRALRPEYIIVLSGISFPAHGHNEDFYAINTIGAINILEVLIQLNQNPKKIIMASSATIYGNQGLELLDESLCPKPANHYGASKYSMETMAQNYFNKLNIIITRPFNYTGKNQDENFLIPKIVSHFKESKKVIELGNLDVSREFNDVEFICEVYEKLLTSDISSQLVNVCSNRGVRLLDVIELMNEIAGYKIEVKVNPMFVRKDEIKTLTGNPKKLFDLIGDIKQKELKFTLREMFEA
jgi:nucleoside-diphosphate-sugar epimerase